MKFSLIRLDSVIDQTRIGGSSIVRIRGPQQAMDLLAQEMAGRDGPTIESRNVEGKELTTYLGIPIGVDGKLKPGLYCIMDLERRVP